MTRAPLRSRRDAKWIPFHRHGKADPLKLDEVADAIDHLLASGEKVVIHCVAGTKRSPLAVAWYLHRKQGMTLDDAYAFMESKRPIVQRMTHRV